MRGTFNKLTSRQARRSAKRAILIALLAATGVSAPQNTAWGQYPSGAKIISRNQTHSMPVKIVHRAPVKIAGTPAGSMRSNPFVVATPPAAPSAPVIQLASGSGPAVRLKPSGTSVGFAPIGGEVPQVSNVPSNQSAGVPAETTEQNMPNQIGVEIPPMMKPREHVAPSIVGVPVAGQSLSSSSTVAPTAPSALETLGPETRMVDETPLTHLAPAATAVLAVPPTVTPAVTPVVVAEPTNAFAKHAREIEFDAAPLESVSDEATELVSPTTPVQIPEPVLAAEVTPQLLPMPVASLPASLPIEGSLGGNAVIESAVVDGNNQVVPVTDARDDQSAIQETQPIFFSLSDSTDADATDVEVAESAALGEGRSEDHESGAAQETDGVSPLAAADGPVHMATPELPTSISLSDVTASDSASAPGFLSAVDTPVHLSPVVTLAQKLPSPVSGEVSAIRINPNIDDEIVSLRAESGVAASLVKPNVSRKAIAVAMPPTIITHGSSDTEFSPAVDGLAHDPTMIVQAESSGYEFDASVAADFKSVNSLEDESQQASSADLPNLNLVDQVAEDVPREAAIHVASNAPRLGDGSTELPPPVTESSAPQLPTPPAVTESAVLPEPMPELTPEPRVRAQLASTRRADGSMTPRLKQNIQPAVPRRPVVLNLSRAQVRSMTIAGRLRRVSIANKDVCQAFAAGANQLKLIGTGLGKTKLTIWADVAPGEPTRVQTFDIDVSNEVDAIGDKISAHTALLNDSIDKAFPRASVVVSRESGKLVVTGRCDNEDTAKQIVRMVRKSCLVPVQDNLLVR